MRLITSICIFLLFSGAFSQETVTLQFCLDKLENNTVQTSNEKMMLRSSQINSQYHLWSLLPNLTASASLNTSFGRRLDPFTNTFATNTVNSQSFGLNSSVMLFNGGVYFHQKNILRRSILRDEISLLAKSNELKIYVISTYISLCKISTQIKLAESRIEKYKQIQKTQLLLLREGRINSIDTLKSNNSLLNEQNILLDLSNDYKMKTLELNLLIGLPLSANYFFDATSISAISEKPRFSESFNIELLEIEQEILVNQLKSARSSVIPTISLNGLLGTGFSTNNKDYLVEGNPTKRYGDQINQNLYEGIGFYLTVPLFNRGEWIKTKQLNTIKQTEVSERRQLAESSLEKRKLELEQSILITRAKIEQVKQMTENLHLIYDKSVLLYSEGRSTYIELETVFMEWKEKLIILEALKLDYEIIKLYE